ncbi:MFS transporter [Streptomyces sp. RKAG293]|uniref:MFS transporter n=1 Tax=Streptomyces sp. RKAG293 TaxID=2893403 RepID=UPI002033B5CD|nr:MFS transporter [Streptomyces sp. RKAG293]MCM2417348.1 MFS transporter [Streptomyces sp. RKAG293]
MAELSSRHKYLVLATLCATMFMAMLDNVVVNTALPRIGQELHAGVSGLQWVVEGYSLVFAALLLTGGTLGDRYGRRRTYLAGLALFTAGSAFAALSGTTGLLIAARMTQGLGAALLTPGSLSILRHTFEDERERARAIGLWSGISAIGLALGPVIGGPMVDAFGWASVFWINVPIGGAALLLGSRVLPEYFTRTARLDLPGQLLAAVGLGGLVYALVEGPSRGWTDPVTLGAAAAGAVALLLFGVVELRTADPMMDLRFFADRVLAGAALAAFTVSFGMFGVMFFLPLYMQNVLGWAPTGSGVAALPCTAMIMIASPLSGRLALRYGVRPPLVAGLTLCAVALAGLSLYGSGARYPQYLWVLPLMGFGMGLSFAPASIAVLRRVAPSAAGMASAALNTVRELGGVVGVAVLGAVLTSRLASGLTHRLESAGTPPRARHDIVASVTGDGAGGLVRGSGLPPALHRTMDASFVDALHLAVRCGAVVMAVTAVAVFLLLRSRPDPVSPVSGPVLEQSGAALGA